jgi:hypothetical protein
MNKTNRVANRIVVLLVGLGLLALGAATIAAASWNPARDVWSSAGGDAQSWLEQAAAATRVGATTVSWLAVGILAAIVVALALIIVAIVRIVSQRRTKTVLRTSGADNPLGRIAVTESFASDAIKNSLAGRDEILSAQVTANDVRRRPVMHVSVTPRQNTSPRELAEHIDELVRNLATLTGQDLPTYISIHTGLRARIAHDRQRLS